MYAVGMRRVRSVAGLLAVVIVIPLFAQNLGTSLDSIYRDETHCLTLREIRGQADNPKSCYCRDALADANYMNQTYLLSGKDFNLTGIYFTLLAHAQEMCGDAYDVSGAADKKDWRWNGPEVRRVYPSNRSIEQIKPDDRGFRSVRYEVQLTYRDQQGGVAKVERYKATERLPADFKSRPCPVSAVCPK